MAYQHPSNEQIKSILENAGNIAVVGLSENPEKTSHMVAKALQARGYRIIPVNPTGDVILGEKCYRTLSDIPEPVDIVNVFRRPEFTAEIAEEAVKIRAKTFWLQLGILNEEAGDIAKRGGLNVIMDRCIKVDDALLRPQR